MKATGPLPLSEEFIATINDDQHGGRVWSATGERGPFCDFSANIWPCCPDADFLQSCIGAVDVYPDPDYRALVAAAAHYYGVNEDQVVPANGSTEALYLAMLTLKPRRVAIFEPTFSEYARAARWANSKVEIQHILADVRSGFRPLLSVPEADVAVLCNPNNPTGSCIPRSDLLAWIEACLASGVIVILDEAFIEFVEGREHSIASSLAQLPNLLVLRSMTKCFGIPGLRLGFALGSGEILRELWDHRIPWSVNAIAQQVGAWFAKRGAAWQKEIAETVARERTFLSENLRQLGWEVAPSAANFILCKLAAGSTNRPLLSRLLQRGFLLRDASNFYGLDDSWVRCAVRQHSENESLLKAIAACM